MQKPLFNQRKKQLRFLSRKLSIILKSGDKEQSNLIERLTKQIQKLLYDMRFYFSKKEVKSLLGATAVVLGLSFNTINAQSFGTKQNNPFGIQPTDAYFNVPVLADMDNDGDMDLLTNDYYGAFHYYENTGSATAPQFASPVLAFNLTAVGYYSPVTVADLDNDGDIDIMVGSNYYYTTAPEFHYFENIGNSTTPQFAAAVVNPFGLPGNADGVMPVFVDLDNDGDMDIMNGDYYGALLYYENSGTAAMPQYTSPVTNPFGLNTTGDRSLPGFADIDEDGDLDLMLGNVDYYGGSTLTYYENTGNNTQAQFSTGVTNPFGINVPYVTTPVFADIDGDADMDLFSMEVYGGLAYFENTSSIGLKEISSFDFNMYPNPAIDIITVETNILVDELIIMDVNGRHITKSSSNTMDVSALNKGLYLLKVINVDGKESIRKFTKL